MTARMVTVALLVALPVFQTHAADQVPAVPAEVEKAVLAEDWAKVAELIGEVKPETPAPQRLTLGHAYLALNRNNESVSAFASTLDEGSLEQWSIWTGHLLKEHPEKAIAWYLRGDAAARHREWTSAAEHFDRALAIDAKCYLALNARGVVAHAVGNTLTARMYFKKAVQARPDFADGYASRGTLNIYLNAAKGLQTDFETAKQLSKDKTPLISLMGVACARYALGDYQSASEMFGSIPEDTDLEALIQRNLLASELAVLERTVRNVQDVGTTLEAIRLPVGEGEFEVSAEVLPNGTVLFSIKPGGWKIWIGIPGIIGGEITGGFDDEGGAQGEEGKQGEGSKEGEGRSQQTAALTVVPELLPPIFVSPDLLPPLLEDGVLFSTTGPGKRGGRGGGITRPPSWPNRTGRGPNRLPPGPQRKPEPARKGSGFGEIIGGMTEAVKGMTTTQVAERNPQGARRPVGGVDSDPGGARSDRGRWGVSNVYGLLYAIHASPRETNPTGNKK